MCWLREEKEKRVPYLTASELYDLNGLTCGLSSFMSVETAFVGIYLERNCPYFK